MDMRAGALAAVTGVSPARQRDWRRRGVLPSTGGRHLRFTLDMAARLKVLKVLSDASVPLDAAASIAESLADAVAGAALGEDTEPKWAIIADGEAHLTSWPLLGTTPTRLLLNVQLIGNELFDAIADLVGDEEESA